ncbi:MAG: DUF3089 domain-containing protein [Flavobacteriales bacterium]|nr:DUF3089 domain-containing protein [Flavobacteriales bacterium]
MHYFGFFIITIISFCSSAQDLDYSDNYNWAYLPGDTIVWPEFVEKDTLASQVDVFFLYPTFLIDKKDERWNYNIDDSTHRSSVINSIRMQGSAWGSAGTIYTPYYRQAHIKAFRDIENDGEKALIFAYNDVRAAFKYYLENYNNGHAIILAGHSQGSVMLSELIKDFFDGKPLQKKLVAAYLPGAGITNEEFNEVKLMTHPESVGGYITWNTFKKNYDQPNYHNWYKGKAVINPVTWDESEFASRDLHKGFYFTNGKMYRESFETNTIDGAIWITVPHFPFRLMALKMKHYHVGDVNLFWEDIRLNSLARIKSYFRL